MHPLYQKTPHATCIPMRRYQSFQSMTNFWQRSKLLLPYWIAPSSVTLHHCLKCPLSLQAPMSSHCTSLGLSRHERSTINTLLHASLNGTARQIVVLSREGLHFMERRGHLHMIACTSSPESTMWTSQAEMFKRWSFSSEVRIVIIPSLRLSSYTSIIAL